MRKIPIFLLALMLSVSIAPYSSFAVDCNSPPSGSGSNWERAYKEWCESCCGTFYGSGPRSRCDPGTNWGCGQQGSQGSGGPSYDYEAERQRQEAEYQRQLEMERQRQQELEEQRRREEEEAKRRQEEFERNKQEALRSMKGIAEGELGLKGDDADGFGLKGTSDTDAGSLGLKEVTTAAGVDQSKKANCEWGAMGASVVDLRCLGLDLNKPVAVDPHVVRGKERAFPAQIDPATFKNVNYNKGFAALKRFDVASAAQAVKYFEQARKERPNDPMVRNGLYLAQDIHKARQQKEKDDKAKAAYFILQSYASMMMGETLVARDYIGQARQYDPSNTTAKFVQSLINVEMGESASHPKRKEAYQLVSGGLVSIYKRHYAVAIDLLEAAQRLQPEDTFIGMFIREMRTYESAWRKSEK